MKKLIGNFIYGSNAKLSALLVVGVLVFVGLGCFGSGKSSSSKPVSSEYYGSWTGSDGSTISIRGDGKGDYKSGGTTVDGGSVEIDDAKKELSITFFGIGPSLKIDSPPAGNEMKLNGVIYKRNGGSTTETKTATSDTPEPKKSVALKDDADGDTPSDSEVESLVKGTIADFAEGVDDEDFITLYTNASKDFQASYTAPQLKANFVSFTMQKDKVVPILKGAEDASAKFTSSPSVRTEKGYKILTANGEFPTRPNTTKFETEYEMQKGSWKLLKFKIQL